MARLAAHYTDLGQRVGLVTNDQAEGLVDTRALSSAGFPVNEVAGACFCCKFNDLVDAAGALAVGAPIDRLLAEPVGSCTDLVATVVEPLKQLHGTQYRIGPLTVLLKPEHGQKILRSETGVGFSPKAAYIFLKQLEEADIIAINKIDKISPAEQQELTELLEQRFPQKHIVALSLRTGEGLDRLIAAMENVTQSSLPLDIDYDTYADGEAEMGWLNAEAVVEGAGLPLDRLALALVETLGGRLQSDRLEAVHLKVLAEGDGGFAVANLVSSSDTAEISLPSQTDSNTVKLTINARVAADPAVLSAHTEAALAEVAAAHSAQASTTTLQHLRPGRPEPTHRLSPSANS